MPTETQIKALEKRVEALHRARIVPPITKWLQTLPTDTLKALVEKLEQGGDLSAEIRKVYNDKNQ